MNDRLAKMPWRLPGFHVHRLLPKPDCLNYAFEARIGAERIEFGVSENAGYYIRVAVLEGVTEPF